MFEKTYIAKAIQDPTQQWHYEITLGSNSNSPGKDINSQLLHHFVVEDNLKGHEMVLTYEILNSTVINGRAPHLSTKEEFNYAKETT
ncbi:hypothetical protein Leryth_005086 [Lithospermum erythrorhizon]|nr:hypothetical protein Leryth_005086 [Lithospermum erythrorhizon]